MDKLRLRPSETDADLRSILHRVVALSGLREAYVAVDCLRGRPVTGRPYHPAFARNDIAAFAIPWVWLMSLDVQARGAHLVIADTLRIPASSVDPTAKNFHWADLTRGQFEAHDRAPTSVCSPTARETSPKEQAITFSSWSTAWS